MTQAETACPDVWGSHFLEYRGRLLALARRNLNPVLARRVSAEDVVQEALLAACGKMVFFENNPEIPVYFKLRMILFQTLTAMERKHLQCLKRDACREVNVTDDSVGSAARLDWNRFADTVTGPLRKAVEALPENDRQILELRHFDDMSNADCAEVLHIGPKAASIRYVRALQRLRKQLMELTEFQP